MTAFPIKAGIDIEVNSSEINAAIDDWRKGVQGAAKRLNDLLGGQTRLEVQFLTETDEKGIKRLRAGTREVFSNVERLNKEFRKGESVQRGSITSLRQQLNELKKIRDSLSIVNEKTGKIGENDKGFTQFQLINRQVKELTTQLRRAEGATQGLFGRLKSTSAFAALNNGARTIQNLVTTIQSASVLISALIRPIQQAGTALARLQGFSLTFKSIGLGATEAGLALRESSRIALGLGAPIDTIRNGFQKLTPVVRNSGGTLQDVSDITEALASRFAAFGLGADESRRVLNGIIQAFAKGKLQAEELTQQISEADPAFKTDLVNAFKAVESELVAFDLGVVETTADLEKLVQEGRVTPEVLLKLIPALSKSTLLYGRLGDSAESAVKSLGGGLTTINQVRNQLQNVNQLSFERLAKSSQPLVNAFLLIQAKVADTFAEFSKLEANQRLANTFARIGEAVAELVELLGLLINFTFNVGNAIAKAFDFIGQFRGLGNFIGSLDKIVGFVEILGSIIIFKFAQPLVKGFTNFFQIQKKVQAALKDTAKTIKDVDVQSNIATVRSDLKGDEREVSREVTSQELKQLAEEKAAQEQVTEAVKETSSAQEEVTVKVEETGVAQGQFVETTDRAVRAQKELTAEAGRTATEINNANVAAQKAARDREKADLENQITQSQKKEADLNEDIAKGGEKLLEVGKEREAVAKQLATAEKELATVQKSLAAKRKGTDTLLYTAGSKKRKEKLEREARLLEKIKKLRQGDEEEGTRGLNSLQTSERNLSARLETDQKKLKDQISKTTELQKTLANIEGEDTKRKIDPQDAESPFDVDLLDKYNKGQDEINKKEQELLDLKQKRRQADAELNKINRELNSLTKEQLTEFNKQQGGKGFKFLQQKAQQDIRDLDGDIENLDKKIVALRASQRELNDEINEGAAGARAKQKADEKAAKAAQESADEQKKATEEQTKADLDASRERTAAFDREQSAKSRSRKQDQAERNRLFNQPAPEPPREKQNLTAAETAAVAAERAEQEKQAFEDARRRIELDKRIEQNERRRIQVERDGLKLKNKGTRVDRQINLIRKRNLKLIGLQTKRLRAFAKTGITNIANLAKAYLPWIAVTLIAADVQKSLQLANKAAGDEMLVQKDKTEQLASTIAGLGQNYKNSETKIASLETEISSSIKGFSATDVVLRQIGDKLKGVANAFAGVKASTNQAGAGINSLRLPFGKAAEEADRATAAVGFFQGVLKGALAGGTIGGLFAGPKGALIGAIAGGIVGGITGLSAALKGEKKKYEASLNDFADKTEAAITGTTNRILALQKLFNQIGANPVEFDVSDISTAVDQFRLAGKELEVLNTRREVLARQTKFKGFGTGEFLNLKGIGAASLTGEDVSENVKFQREVLNVKLSEFLAIEGSRTELQRLFDKKFGGSPISVKINGKVSEFEVNPDAFQDNGQIDFSRIWFLDENGDPSQNLTNLGELDRGKFLEGLIQRLADAGEISQTAAKRLSELDGELNILDQLYKKLGTTVGKFADDVNLSVEDLEAGLSGDKIAEKAKLAEAAFRKLNFEEINKDQEKFQSLLDKTIKEYAEASVALKKNTIFQDQAASFAVAAGFIDLALSDLGKGSKDALDEAQGSIDNFINKFNTLDPKTRGEIDKIKKNFRALRDAQDDDAIKRLDVKLELLFTGRQPEDVTATLRDIQEITSALSEKSTRLSIDSTEIDAVLEKLRRSELQQQLGALTSDELREKNFQNQLSRIDRVQQKDQQRHQNAISQIDKEIAAVDRFYDARIKAAQEASAGPASEELEKLKKAELIAKAQKGGREGLEAAAQLEQQEKAARLKKLEEEKQEKINKLNEQKRQREEQFQEKQEAYLAKKEQIENKIYAIQLKRLELEEKIIQSILSGREGDAGEQNRLKAAKDLEESFISINGTTLKGKEILNAWQEPFNSINGSAINLNEQMGALGGNVIEVAGQIIDLGAGLQEAATDAEGLGQQVNNVAGDAEATAQAQADAAQEVEGATRRTEELADETQNLETKVKENKNAIQTSLVAPFETLKTVIGEVSAQLDEVFSKSYVINVKLNTARKEGGPVSKGGTYTVNEAGREGFLNARTGELSAIQKGAFGKFRPKDDGLVIPAGLWKDMNQAGPAKEITSRQPVNHQGGYSNRSQGTRDLVRAFGSVAASNASAIRENSRMQAVQASEIGRLSSAVHELVEKKWTIQTNVKTSSSRQAMKAIQASL